MYRENNPLTKYPIDTVVAILFSEIMLQALRVNIIGDALREETGAGFLDSIRVQVRAEYVVIRLMTKLMEALVDKYGYRVGFLPGGTSNRPGTYLFPRALVLNKRFASLGGQFDFGFGLFAQARIEKAICARATHAANSTKGRVRRTRLL